VRWRRRWAERRRAFGLPRAGYQVRKKLRDIAHELPQGVRGPFFNDEFVDTCGNLYANTGAGFSHPELRDAADAFSCSKQN
jgi:multidrug efflux pump